ncbi:MAG: hypothetical protein VXV96_09955 [Bdellovibrionota bacterium]|nr:hypothetical protein [Bdellovibrionota bacterium]
MWAQKLAGNNYTVAGVIPLVDSKDYFQGAIGLNDFGILHEWAGRRPLNHLFFGGLFYLAGENHFLMFWIVTGLVGLGTYLFSKNVYQSISKMGAFYIPLAVYYFYRQYMGSFLSESIGLTMSLLSINFLFLVRKKDENKDSLKFLCLSLLSLCIGLNARAGNFFAPFGIVICYLIWGRFALKKIKVALLLFATLFFGMSFNKLARSLHSIEGSSTSNLGYTLYGVARGGKGWTQFSKDFPKLNLLEGQAHLDAVKQVTIDSIKKEPLLFIKGSLIGLKVFLTHYFTFLPNKFRLLEYLLLCVAFFLFLRRRVSLRDFHPFYSSVVFVLFTNIMTSPLLAYDGHQRVYAATISFVMFSFSFGFYLFETKLDNVEVPYSNYINYGKLALVLFLLISPLFFSSRINLKGEPTACLDGNELIFQFRKQYSLNYRAVEPLSSKERPLKTNKETMDQMVSGTNVGEIHYVLNGQENYTLFSAIDIKKKKYSLEKIRNFPENLKDGLYQFCMRDKELISYKKL